MTDTTTPRNGAAGTPPETRCRHVKEDGERCGMVRNIDPSTGFCVWHDPARKQEAANMRRKGGKESGARAKARKPAVRVVNADECPPPPTTLEEATHWLSWLSWAVTTGKIDGRTAHESAYALRAFVDGRKHVDRTDERVKALEAKLKEVKAATGGGR